MRTYTTELLDSRALAKRLGVGHKRIGSWVASKRIAGAEKRDGVWLYDLGEVIRAIRDHKEEPIN